MRIGCLQFAPKLGEVQINIKRANEILSEANILPGDVDLLVLPELAFADSIGSTVEVPSLVSPHITFNRFINFTGNCSTANDEDEHQGYNHTYESIQPCLEANRAGITYQWATETATKLQATVIVGYAEVYTPNEAAATSDQPQCPLENDPFDSAKPHTHFNCYNSTLTVDSTGTVIANYRKSFLYYTDARWSCAGNGFEARDLVIPTRRSSGPEQSGPLNSIIKITHGICMDINPRNFTAPWSDYEFASHTMAAEADMAIVSMAWLTLEMALDEDGGVNASDSEEKKRLRELEESESRRIPDMNTLGYWVERFEPCVGRRRWEDVEERDENEDDEAETNGEDVYHDKAKSGKPITLVMANRCGVEGDVRYAGTSTVMRVQGNGEVKLWGILGKGEERCLVVDTEKEPPLALRSAS